MKNRFALILVGLVILVGLFLSKFLPNNNINSQQKSTIISGSFDQNQFKTNEEWKKILTPEQYHILREAGTETPYTGILNNEKRRGTYYSAGCDKPIFRSEQKYDSKTGWPSFTAPINEDALVLRRESNFRR